VNDALSPFDLIRVIIAISQMWCLTDPATSQAEHAARRGVIHKAIVQLVSVKPLHDRA
jgi:hypothetical protein